MSMLVAPAIWHTLPVYEESNLIEVHSSVFDFTVDHLLNKTFLLMLSILFCLLDNKIFFLC